IVSRKFKLCRNRLWSVVKNINDDKDRTLFLTMLGDVEEGKLGKHDDDHIHCTFEFCENWRMNTTQVDQRHESDKDPGGTCSPSILADDKLLKNAVDSNSPTAWRLDRKGLIEDSKLESFMAISHVWADGTGKGILPAGQVNSCLYEYFEERASKFGCKGIW